MEYFTFLKIFYCVTRKTQNILRLQVMSAGHANQIISFEADFIELLDEDFIVNISKREKELHGYHKPFQG